MLSGRAEHCDTEAGLASCVLWPVIPVKIFKSLLVLRKEDIETMGDFL